MQLLAGRIIQGLFSSSCVARLQVEQLVCGDVAYASTRAPYKVHRKNIYVTFVRVNMVCTGIFVCVARSSRIKKKIEVNCMRWAGAMFDYIARGHCRGWAVIVADPHADDCPHRHLARLISLLPQQEQPGRLLVLKY